MDQPPRNDSPFFRLLGAIQNTIGAARDTASAAAKNICVACGVKSAEPDSRLCKGCGDDAADATAGALGNVVERAGKGILRDILRGGRR